jgi:hypothetical protein
MFALRKLFAYQATGPIRTRILVPCCRGKRLLVVEHRLKDSFSLWLARLLSSFDLRHYLRRIDTYGRPIEPLCQQANVHGSQFSRRHFFTLSTSFFPS